MGKNKIESVSELTPEEAARFLRDIASSLESGRVDLGNGGLDWDAIRKLKLKLRNSEGHVSLKAEVKPHVDRPKREPHKSGQGVGSKARQRPYKAVKKDMEKTFRGIQSALQQEGLPTPKEARDLHGQAREMLQQAGRDRDGCRAFLELTEAFVQAVQEEDRQRCRDLVRELERAEQKCHARFA